VKEQQLRERRTPEAAIRTSKIGGKKKKKIPRPGKNNAMKNKGLKDARSGVG